MDDEALALTRSTGLVHFFSRSRQRLWQKGETSGNVLHVTEVALDCDEDAVLVSVHADGPTCHVGSTSCFSPWLWRRILRRESENAPGSYVASQLQAGVASNARKVGEEAVELAVAALSEDDERVVSEAATCGFTHCCCCEVADWIPRPWTTNCVDVPSRPSHAKRVSDATRRVGELR